MIVMIRYMDANKAVKGLRQGVSILRKVLKLTYLNFKWSLKYNQSRKKKTKKFRTHFPTEIFEHVFGLKLLILIFTVLYYAQKKKKRFANLTAFESCTYKNSTFVFTIVTHIFRRTSNGPNTIAAISRLLLSVIRML